MSDRVSSCRIATATLALFVVVLSASTAQADGVHRRDLAAEVSAIQEYLSIRILWQNTVDFLHAVVAHYEGPPPGQNPGHHSPGSHHDASREGTGICPGGNPPPGPKP